MPQSMYTYAKNAYASGAGKKNQSKKLKHKQQIIQKRLQIARAHANTKKVKYSDNVCTHTYIHTYAYVRAC